MNAATPPLHERGLGVIEHTSSDFTRLPLPREVLAKIEAVTELEHSTGTEPIEVLTGRIRMVGKLLLSPLQSLGAVNLASMQVHALLSANDARAGLLATLDRVVQKTTESIGRSAVGYSGELQEIAAAAERARQRIQTADANARHAVAASAALREAIESLTESIGIFALQNRMMGRFAAELLSGSAAELAGHSMQPLHQTLAAELDNVITGITETNQLTKSTPEIVSEASSKLDAVVLPTLQWLDLTEGAVVRLGPEALPIITHRLQRVRTELQRGFSWPEHLGSLLAELAGTEVQIDDMPLKATVKFIGILAADIT